MSFNPRHNVFRVGHFGPRRQHRSVDHQNRKAKRARRLQLGLRPAAARVFRYNQLNLMALQQGGVVRHVERPSRDDNVVLGQGWRLLRRVDKPQHVVMLRLCGKPCNLHPTNRQKNPLCGAIQSVQCAVHVRNALPLITVLWDPSVAHQGQQRHARCLARRKSISAHLIRKGMGRVHQMRHGVVPQVRGETLDAAKPADPHRDRLRLRRFNPTGIGQHRRHPGVSDTPRQSRRLGGAAQDQKVRSHG